MLGLNGYDLTRVDKIGRKIDNVITKSLHLFRKNTRVISKIKLLVNCCSIISLVWYMRVSLWSFGIFIVL